MRRSPMPDSSWSWQWQRSRGSRSRSGDPPPLAPRWFRRGRRSSPTAAVKHRPIGVPEANIGVPSLGEGFFGGYMIAARSGRGRSRISKQPPVSETKDGFTLTGSQNHGELAMDATHVDDKTGVTTKLVTKTSVVPCPDADGRFEAEAVIDVTVSKGSTGQHGVLDVKVVGHVDDEAHLTSSDLDYTMKWSNVGWGNRAGQRREHAVSWRRGLEDGRPDNTKAPAEQGLHRGRGGT